MESYYGTILGNHITGLYYGIILRIHHVKRSPGIPETTPRPPGNSGDLVGTCGDRQGTLWGPPTDHKNDGISKEVQRQKISIGASESFLCKASAEGHP